MPLAGRAEPLVLPAEADTFADMTMPTTPRGATPFMCAFATSEGTQYEAFMRFNLAELNVVKNEAGHTNLISILGHLQTRTTRPGGGGKWLQDFRFTGIDVLNLSVGRANFIDLSEAGNNREIRVDLRNQIFKQVKSDADVYGILFMIWLRSGGSFSLAPADLPRVTAGKP